MIPTVGKMHKYLRIPARLVCIVFANLLNSALAAPTIVSVSVTSSEFVIDSDASRGGAGYDRDEIAVRSPIGWRPQLHIMVRSPGLL